MRSVIQRLAGLCLAVFSVTGTAHGQQPLDYKDPGLSKRASIVADTVRLTYPVSARRAKQEGLTRLSLCVDEKGRPSDVKLVQSSGASSLDNETINTIKRAQFRPAEIGGAPVAICNFLFDFAWKLDTGDRYPKLAALKPDRPPVWRAGVPPPEYPAGWVEKVKPGKVQMVFCVGPDGKAEATSMAHSSGDPKLDAAFYQWVQKNGFEPAMKGGGAVGVCGVSVEYDWRLPKQN